MGEIRLRDLLSFTAGISSDVLASEDATITLDEAVLRVYEDQSPTASPPAPTSTMGLHPSADRGAHGGRATGLAWRQLYDEQLRVPLGWSAASTYLGAPTRILPAAWSAPGSSTRAS